ncbi:hypothetical protein ONZ51_g2657 [Trametes cubensis]|uniref:Uncharacterized protein n=1 Tax=Trametes cubensis TaxID=1111947 RepID=A0AAD7TZ69_9APHY|nr:hypothetical protein ONZ51_g2657 [Trametes cubensis]
MMETTHEVAHRNHPDDGILNLAQLTNAAQLAMFRPRDARYPDLASDVLIDRAIVQRSRLIAEAEQKKTEAAQRKEGRSATRGKRKRPTQSVSAHIGQETAGAADTHGEQSCPTEGVVTAGDSTSNRPQKQPRHEVVKNRMDG